MEQVFISSLTHHFNLRHHNINKPSPIYIVIRWSGKQYKIPLGVKVLPQHFEHNKAIVGAYMSEMDNINNKIVNERILEYQKCFLSLQQLILNNPDGDIISFINQLFTMVKRRETKKELAIAIITRTFIDQPMKDSTRKQYDTILNEFIDYIKSKGNVYIEDITPQFMGEYLNYLRNSKVTHKITGEKVYLEDNTVKNRFEVITTILGYVEKVGLIDNVEKIKKLTPRKNDNTFENQIYLDEDEIETLRNVNLKPNLDKVRKIFLFQMELGQRISDIQALVGKDIKPLINDGTIEITQKKTGTKVYPPLNEYCILLLEEWEYKIPDFNVNKVNPLLKEIGELCGFNTPCHCQERRKGELYTYDVPKYKLISTHSARRSFITNGIKSGISSHLIKGISGHKSAEFDKYNRASNKDLSRAFVNAKMGNAPQAPSTLNPDPIPEQIDNGLIMELKNVLVMLGVAPYDWINEFSIDNLFRMIHNREELIRQKTGVDYKTLKEIFNGDGNIKERTTRLRDLLQNK